MRAAWSRHGTVSDLGAQLYCCALRNKNAPCGHVPAAHHAQLGAQSVTCCMAITTAFCVNASQEAVIAAQWHRRFLEMFRPTRNSSRLVQKPLEERLGRGTARGEC
jgi:hypothetical protein